MPLKRTVYLRITDLVTTPDKTVWLHLHDGRWIAIERRKMYSTALPLAPPRDAIRHKVDAKKLLTSLPQVF
jgi:hypothetical protein